MPQSFFKDDQLSIHVVELEAIGAVRIHLEHQSGAALIVPSCVAVVEDGRRVFRVTGFDGTRFTLSTDEGQSALEIVATTSTPLLGGETVRVVPRAADPAPGGVRVTGDESTMPIPVEDD